ncbi:Cupin-like domain-containing protein [Nocardia amikacinitolerans]|uniref:Cupin-like domain-containing protein n=1 Tax=Nocardia amikacinitolerans TaxID=756689 RepID=A0A285L3X4_9NOCA|nr:cupin-like domain-containing protein [Nocardia amikacinitolerans]MCP2279466.1 Cupin-like domain-containing protein [Nocardia amikacinitolerans]MCP2296737.1 Cupin-like domain-containing protein [Nocardia amikacinitolerans]SNY78757.1 Cupin-like domain-containing protein [Nocardia amikacinitolerans]
MPQLRPATAPLSEYIAKREPAFFPGLAAGWPAVQRWEFHFLGRLRPELSIELVRGDRESAATHFTESTLGAYMELLANDDSGEESLYLKEFNLLRWFPQLRSDISARKELFPRRVFSPPPGVWVGPADARTGAHYDLLGNIAVVIRGNKRFRIAPPGFVERADALSTKYDPWARLSALPLVEIAAATRTSEESLYEVELGAGDVIYVPDHWWHEVYNRSASILLSGFFGTYEHVAMCAIRVAARHLAHLARLDGGTACTCHETVG